MKSELLNKSLVRPDWSKQEHRALDKLWLDKNECADPIMNNIVAQAVSKIPAEAVFSYPELDTLYNKIASIEADICPENILLTAGSDGAIRACFESFVEINDKVVLTRPTFAMYEIYSKIYGTNVTWLDYKKSSKGPILNIDDILSTIKEVNPKMVCLPNPDSPTGTVFSLKDLEEIIKISDEVGAIILIDEAYYPIYPVSVTKLIDQYHNLVVIRSFSKAWGAAGLRTGYVLANQELITLMHKQRPMYEIGNVSAKALEILLDYEEEMKLSVKRVSDGKKYFQDSMVVLGFSTYESYGNFLHVKFGEYANEIHTSLEKVVYYRKDFNISCLAGYSRFSSTTVERFKPIVDCITSVMMNLNNKDVGNDVI